MKPTKEVQAATNVTWYRDIGDGKIAVVVAHVVEVERTTEGTYCATVEGAEGTLAAAGKTKSEAVKAAHELILDRANYALKQGMSLRDVMGDVPHGIYKLIPSESTVQDDGPLFGPRWATTQAPVAAHA